MPRRHRTLQEEVRPVHTSILGHLERNGGDDGVELVGALFTSARRRLFGLTTKVAARRLLDAGRSSPVCLVHAIIPSLRGVCLMRAIDYSFIDTHFRKGVLYRAVRDKVELFPFNPPLDASASTKTCDEETVPF